MTCRQLCSWPLRKSRDKPVGRRWSFSAALNPKRGRFPAICKFFFVSLPLGRCYHTRLGTRPGVPEVLGSHSRKRAPKSPRYGHYSTTGYARRTVSLVAIVNSSSPLTLSHRQRGKGKANSTKRRLCHFSNCAQPYQHGHHRRLSYNKPSLRGPSPPSSRRRSSKSWPSRTVPNQGRLCGSSDSRE